MKVLCIRIVFNADTDPAFKTMVDLNPDPFPDQDQVSKILGFGGRKLGKNILLKKITIFKIKSRNLFIPRTPQRTPKVPEKPSVLKREHPALQSIKFISFLKFLCVILALVDPDPADKNQQHWYEHKAQLNHRLIYQPTQEQESSLINRYKNAKRDTGTVKFNRYKQ
jgi:hypothetical protein